MTLLHENTCNQLTGSFTLLQTYHPGDPAWVTSPDIPYNLWFDPESHNDVCAQERISMLNSISTEISPTPVDRLNMLFQAQLAGQTCLALLDTGATATFITEKQVKCSGLRIFQDTSTMWGTGHNKLHTKGTVTLPIKVGQFKTKVTATVVENIVPGVDLVLGQDFQHMTKCIIDCVRNTATLHHPCGRSCSIHPINNTMCILMK